MDHSLIYSSIRRRPIYFVSAPQDLTDEEFIDFYRDRLLAAIKDNGLFYITDGRGADEKIARFLKNNNADVVLYHIGYSPNRNICQFSTKGGYRNEEERDRIMTRDSTQDILWIRAGDKSRVYHNYMRRLYYNLPVND
jgi:hypothetical protein